MEIRLQNTILPFSYELPSSVPTMPQNNPWDCPEGYHVISHRESAEQFGKSSEITMIIILGKKVTNGKIIMNKKKLTPAGFEPRLPNET